MKKLLTLLFSASILGGVVVYAAQSDDAPYFSATKAGRVITTAPPVVSSPDAGTTDAGTSAASGPQKSKP